MAAGFYKFFKADGSPHPKLNAALTFFLFATTELHLGFILITMQRDNVKIVQRPNVGLGFRLF